MATALTVSLLAAQGELMGMRACGVPLGRGLELGATSREEHHVSAELLVEEGPAGRDRPRERIGGLHRHDLRDQRVDDLF